MDDAIAQLFETLRDRGTGANEVTYGQELHVSDKQTRALVALAHLFPNRLTPAIDLIEAGCCVVLMHNGRTLYFIDGNPVAIADWSCCCSDFARQLEMLRQPRVSRWEVTCQHLLAAFIVHERFPILDYASVEKRNVSLAEIVDVSLGEI